MQSHLPLFSGFSQANPVHSIRIHTIVNFAWRQKISSSSWSHEFADLISKWLLCKLCFIHCHIGNSQLTKFCIKPFLDSMWLVKTRQIYLVRLALRTPGTVRVLRLGSCGFIIGGIGRDLPRSESTSSTFTAGCTLSLELAEDIKDYT